MPSSSTRSTELEKTILVYFKNTYCRLRHASLHSQKAFVTGKFANLLDYDAQDLEKMAPPPYVESRWGYPEDCSTWSKFQKKLREVRQSKNVWQAGDMLADVGNALCQVGRQAEAAGWFRWCGELQDMAEDMWREEEEGATRFKAG